MQRNWNIRSLLRRDRPLDRPTAWVCLLTNQFVTPGLGSILAGRVWSGLVEVALSGAGFCLVMAWLVNLFKVVWSGLDRSDSMRPYAWQGKLGLLLFVAGWLLALISSVRIVCGARRPNVPPRL